jgi:hypothetical protein
LEEEVDVAQAGFAGGGSGVECRHGGHMVGLGDSRRHCLGARKAGQVGGCHMGPSFQAWVLVVPTLPAPICSLPLPPGVGQTHSGSS